ncbi:MAG: NnrS family protein [Polaromonas sp.]
MFTNSIAGASATKRPWLEKAALGTTLALLPADVLQLHGTPLAALAGLCAAAQLARWALWQPWKTGRTPLVWVLHIAYFWIPVHLALRGLAELGWVMPSVAVHALTVGAIGGLIIGMMTRTALGHTGRPLKAGRADVVCYLLVLAAALIRVFVPPIAPAQLVNSVLGSAALWSSGFALYAVSYWPVLARVRVDGKPG